MTIYLYEIVHYNPATSAEETLRVSTQGFVDNATGTLYPKRILQAGGFGVFAYSEGSTYGDAELQDGQIVLANLDRAYDGLRDHDFRSVTIKMIERGQQLSDAVTLAVCEVESAELTWQQLTLTVIDRMAALNIQAMTATYAGDNTDNYGVEGNAQLEGKIKPVLLGKVGWFEPDLVNAASLLYAINHASDGTNKAVHSVDGIKDNGVDITIAADYATITLLVDATIPSGQAATCLAAGVFRLNNAPAGVVTCRATESATSNTVAQVVERFVTGYTDFGSISGLSDIDTDYDFDAGYYLSSSETALEVTSFLMGSINGWVVPTICGGRLMGRLIDPSGETAIATFVENDIIRGGDGGLNRIPMTDQTGGIPAFKAVIEYQRFYRPLRDSEFAGSVSAADRQELAQEYRAVEASDSSIITTYQRSEPIIFQTALFDKADAQTVADDQLALRKVWRDLYIVDSPLSGVCLNVGDIVSLHVQAFGLEGGKNFQIIGVILDIGREAVTYYLYG